jgi:hypothetical protein
MATQKAWRAAIVDAVRKGTIDAVFEDEKGCFVTVRLDGEALQQAGIRVLNNELFLYEPGSGRLMPYAPAFEQEARRLLSWADTY